MVMNGSQYIMLRVSDVLTSISEKRNISHVHHRLQCTHDPVLQRVFFELKMLLRFERQLEA